MGEGGVRPSRSSSDARLTRPSHCFRPEGFGNQLATGQQKCLPARSVERAGRHGNPIAAGRSSKRLKGLEPSTFCMASRPLSSARAALSLHIDHIGVFAAPATVSGFVAFRWSSGTQLAPSRGAEQMSRAPGPLPRCTASDHGRYRRARCCARMSRSVMTGADVSTVWIQESSVSGVSPQIIRRGESKRLSAIRVDLLGALGVLFRGGALLGG
jgi:hypothetical protein